MVSSEARTGLLGLGSNVGERLAHLQAAVDGLPAVGVEVFASSSVYDTDPVGEVLDQPSFLNACLLIRTALDPLGLLELQAPGFPEVCDEAAVSRLADRAGVEQDQVGLGALGRL